MRKVISIIIFNLLLIPVHSQNTSFFIAGNEQTYYPVAFKDDVWGQNKATQLKIGRSTVHQDQQWHGSLIAEFKYHLSYFGNGSDFIDADIKQYNVTKNNFIAGWEDISKSSNNQYLIVWLRGNTTYHFHCSYPQTPIFSSGPLVFGDMTIPTKTQIAPYVNSNGLTSSTNIWSNGPHSNYFNGNVGLGITSPEAKLDVNGNINSRQNIQLGGQISLNLNDNLNYQGKNFGHYAIGWISDSWYTGANTLWQSGYGGIKYFTEGTLRMAIHPNGNVGIGTENPQNKLDVAGTIRAQEIKVELTGWADYVFDKNYKLPSLQEVKAHIEQHKHLPGIPSEKQVLEEGLNMGEMQAKLLQKIEELTLYVIQQQNEIDELKKKLNDE